MVIVLPGLYAGFDLEASGTPEEPITFLGQTGAVIVEPNPRTPDGINVELASYVVVEGFEVTRMSRAGVRAVGLPDHSLPVT